MEPIRPAPQARARGGADLDLRTRTLRAVHTPGHTLGHLVYHDAASEIMFAGDHVLPHITPSIGFEPAGNRMALRDYLSADGTPGYFRQKLYVYERAQLPCRRCRMPIRQLTQGQRSTYYCPGCQK